jgi:hypothetical protein
MQIGCTASVTGLGDFSPIRRLLTMRCGLKITEIAQILGLLFQCYQTKMRKNGWATFWATFSQTHLVTLVVPVKGCSRRFGRQASGLVANQWSDNDAQKLHVTIGITYICTEKYLFFSVHN